MHADPEFEPFLTPTPTIQSGHPRVLAFAAAHAAAESSPRDAAVKLYYAVRDAIRYDPYLLELSEEG